jgi:hypothetical protein
MSIESNYGPPGPYTIKDQAEEPTDATPEGDIELTEELAETAIINQLVDDYIMKVSGWFIELNEVSEQGNPVRTHMSMLSVCEGVVEEAYELRRKLLEQVAKKGYEITTTGTNLTKQVLDEEN